ncbi:VirB4 family type IV secretion system protein [Pedobacter nutrimenti]|uniref:Type IV secretory pathway VirB4 component n=1 Tax=Pedobacter nutrimenti TaxID=1241337 RepID=A0A318U686_9SPHI|nr:DUF87 domain-containing protein [Pedobacter nutrimenti]PYF68441.1 type IV secretory pathway VirB4 component [Pedobacter nutrimenti]
MLNQRKVNSGIEYSPVYTYEDNLSIMNDGCISIGYKVGGIEYDQLTSNQIEKINETLVQSIKSLPIGSIIHKTDIYYNVIFEAEKQNKLYFTNKLNDHLEGRKMLFHKGFIFLSLPQTKNKVSKVNALTSALSASVKDHFSVLQNPFRDIETRKIEALRIARSFPKNFAGLFGITINQLSETELRSFGRMYGNQEFVREQKSFNRTITADPSTVYIGEKGQQFITMNGQGLSISDEVRNEVNIISPFAQALGHDLYFPHAVHTVIRINDTKKELSSLDLSVKLNRNMDIAGNQENQLIAAETQDMTRELREKGTPMVSLKLTVQVSDINPAIRQKQIDEALTAFRELNGAEAYVETFDPLQTFMSFYPGNAGQCYNYLDMPADNAACYLNWTTNYRTDKKGILLMDRMRNPLLINFLSEKLNNRNGLFVGPTGSGKSHFAGNLMLQYYEQGVRQIVIDNGGTYKNLIKHSLNEKYFEYDYETPIKLNPFNIERNKDTGRYDLRIGDKLQYLISLLTIIWQGTKTTEVSDNPQNSVFEKLIPRFYSSLQQDEVATITKFWCWLDEFVSTNEKEKEKNRDYRQMAGSFNFEQFLLTIEKFTEKGMYGDIFNSEVDEDISDYQLCCFDMAKIKSNATIYPVIGLVITQLALDMIRKYPDDYKILWIDEAWSLLEGLESFIELKYRTIRKNKGSVFIITQSSDDVHKSSIKAAILGNSAIHVILDHSGAQKENAVDLLREHLGYTDQEIDKIKSIQRDPDNHWRELLIKLGDTTKVFVSEVCPEMGAALSSNPDERNQLNRLINRYNGNTKAAINQFVADKKEAA